MKVSLSGQMSPEEIASAAAQIGITGAPPTAQATTDNGTGLTGARDPNANKNADNQRRSSKSDRDNDLQKDGQILSQHWLNL